MKAHQIRNILNEETIRLFNVKGNRKAGYALNEFVANSTDNELIRFRELLIGLPNFKLPHEGE